MKAPVKVLVIDIGGTNVKILASGQTERRKFPSGKDLTPRKMVAGVKRLAKGWKYDVVSIGYPGPVREGRPAAEPHNLARGWVGFDFPAAFGCPVKMINDAAMQALGSYRRGTMLFLGLGTGLGTALVVDGTVVPLELGASLDREEDVRGRSRDPRAQEAGQEEVAEARRGGHGAIRLRAPPRRGRPRRRERQEADEAAAGLPDGRQRQRVHSADSGSGRGAKK